MKKWCVSKELNGQFGVLTCMTKCLVMESKTKKLVTKCRKGKKNRHESNKTMVISLSMFIDI